MAAKPSIRHVKDVCKLATHLLEHESLILHRRCKLSLTTSVLAIINASLELLQKAEGLWEWDPGIEYNQKEYLEALNFFASFFHRVRDVQIIQELQHERQQLDLSKFHNIHSLELKNVAFGLVTGLETVQNRLQEFMCHNSDISINDFLSFNPHGMDSVCLWTSLQKVVIVKCGLRDIHSALRRIPSLKYLDLSYNCLSNVSEIKFLINLEYLNLSYNNLSSIPPLNSLAVLTLKTLLLRNNKLENLQGLQEATELNEVDLRYNCLVYKCKVEPLYHLKKLQSLWLDGNPLCHTTDYRFHVAQILHQNALHTNFFIDGIQISRKEIKQVQSVQKRNIIHRNNIIGGRIVNAVSEENITCTNSLSEASVISNDTVDSNENSVISSVRGSQVIATGVKLKSKRSEKKSREAVIVDRTEVKVQSEETSALKMTAKSLPEVAPQVSLPLLKKDPVVVESSVKQNSVDKPLHLDLLDQSKELLDPAKKDDTEKIETQKITENHSTIESDAEGDYSQSADHDSSDNCSTLVLDKTDSLLDDCKKDFPIVEIFEEQSEKQNQEPSRSDAVVDSGDDNDSDTKVILDFADLATNVNPDMIEPLSPVYEEEPLRYTLHEDVPEERIFLAQQYVNKELHDVMLIVGEKHIQQIDGLSGRVKELLDLKTLKSVTHSITTIGLLEIHLYFDPPRKKPQEKIYILENEENVQKLEEFLRPFTEILTEPTLQCLKCGTHLTKYEVRCSVVHSPQVADLESSNEFGTLESLKPADVSEVEVCPKCGSSAIVDIEKEESDFANSESAENSFEKSTSTVFEKKMETLFNIALSRTDEDDGHILESERMHGRHDSISVGSNEYCGTEGDLLAIQNTRKISGSDITILSNPSQSSIVRIPETGAEAPESALDVIAESPYSLSPVAFCNYDLKSPRAICNDDKQITSDRVSALSESSIETLLNSQEMHSLSHDQNTRSYFSKSLLKASDSLLPFANTQSDENADMEKSSVELWEELNKTRQLTYDNFVVIDHRLKLYFEVSILGQDEEFEGMLQTSILLQPFCEEFQGYLVLSTKKAYVLRVSNDQRHNKDDPSTWVQLLSSKSLEQLKRIVILLGSQGFWFEWEKEPLSNAAKLWQLFLIKDADCCNCYISFLTELIEKKLKVHQSEPAVEVIAEEDIEDLVRDVISWSPPGHSVTDEFSSEVLVYQIVHWQLQGIDAPGQGQMNNNEGFAVCVITPTDIYIATMKPQVPMLTTSKKKGGKNAKEKFSPLARQSISYLMSVHLRPDLQQVGMHFMDYKEQDEILWLITTENRAGMVALLNTLKGPWESCFQIPLDLKLSTGCECGV